MRIILLIQSYPGANELLWRHWPYYEKSGCSPIIGIGTTDGLCRWPNDSEHVDIGENLYICREHLPKRLINTFKHGLSRSGWDRCAVIEYDTCFFRPIPDTIPTGLVTQLTGYMALGSTAKSFYHNPWIADRQTAEQIVAGGEQMIREGDLQGGSPDTFLGRLCERFSIPVDTTSLKYYSKNTIHPGHPWVEEARRARIDGAHVIHGIKHASVLERIAG